MQVWSKAMHNFVCLISGWPPRLLLHTPFINTGVSCWSLDIREIADRKYCSIKVEPLTAAEHAEEDDSETWLRPIQSMRTNFLMFLGTIHCELVEQVRRPGGGHRSEGGKFSEVG